jgi:hypothetical protein
MEKKLLFYQLAFERNLIECRTFKLDKKKTTKIFSSLVWYKIFYQVMKH